MKRISAKRAAVMAVKIVLALIVLRFVFRFLDNVLV